MDPKFWTRVPQSLRRQRARARRRESALAVVTGIAVAILVMLIPWIVFAAEDPSRASVGGDLRISVVVFFVATAASTIASRGVRRQMVLKAASWVIALWPRAEQLYARARALLLEEAQALCEERPVPPPTTPPLTTLRTTPSVVHAVRILLPDVTRIEMFSLLTSPVGDVIVSDIFVWRDDQRRSVTSAEWEALRRAGALLLERDVVDKLAFAMAAASETGRA